MLGFQRWDVGVLEQQTLDTFTLYHLLQKLSLKVQTCLVLLTAPYPALEKLHQLWIFSLPV